MLQLCNDRDDNNSKDYTLIYTVAVTVSADFQLASLRDIENILLM